MNSSHISNNKRSKGKELNIVKDTPHNNEYNMNLGVRHPNQHKNNKNTDPQHQKTKWATFTYSGKETKKITKVFKETNKRSIPNMKHKPKHSKLPSTNI
jgi:hypothetical protein